jgi:alkaline phosphatase D
MKKICFLVFLVLAQAALGALSEPDFRLLILGCLSQDNPAPALPKAVVSEPDLTLWIGDNVYADSTDDIGYIRRCYETLAAKPGFAELRAKAPWIATWDDHDYGYNNAGKEYPLKTHTKALFREFWLLEDRLPADRDGVYYTETREIDGQVIQFILLDVRYNRDEPGTGGDVLGQKQWAWLENELAKPADLRLIISGFQILLDARAGSETWAKFETARQRLFDVVRSSGAQGTLFVTGDQHYGEVLRLPGALDYDAIELQFAGVNQIEDPEWNPLRVANVSRSEHSYALLDFHLTETRHNVPHLHYQVVDARSGQTEISYRVNIWELKTSLAFVGMDVFTHTGRMILDHRFPRLIPHYTLDGTIPTADSPSYVEPVEIRESCTVHAALFDLQGRQRSPIFSRSYRKLDAEPGVILEKPVRGLSYTYYEGKVEKLDDMKALPPLAEGILAQGNYLDPAAREDHFGFVYEGYLYFPTDGVYTLATYSDDGTRLFVNDRLVVDNDGSHSPRHREGIAVLQTGYHRVRLEYFEDYAGQQLILSYTGSDGQVTRINPANWYRVP